MFSKCFTLRTVQKSELCCKKLIFYYTIPSCKDSLEKDLKTLWEEEKMLVIKIFSFMSGNVA